jgi:hypothetical protein
MSVDAFIVCVGKFKGGSEAREILPSLLPDGTCHPFPPLRITLSRLAKAKMSAQDTTPGHAFSSADFTLSMALYPCRPALIGSAAFSELAPSRSNEPSHPWHYD